VYIVARLLLLLLSLIVVMEMMLLLMQELRAASGPFGGMQRRRCEWLADIAAWGREGDVRTLLALHLSNGLWA
jgi:hypothetical protein